MLLLAVTLLSFSKLSVIAQSNLPDVPAGVFEVSTRTEIRTTTAAVWGALTNFTAYPEWNPFVREATVVTPFKISLPEQYPVEGANLIFRTQIPPLPLPVDASTPDKLLNTQYALEIITHVEPDLLRLAWGNALFPSAVLAAERWQAISELSNGLVLYESREVFSGALASTLQRLYGTGLQQAFDAQGDALKLLLEV
ncbi:hypothetical protein M011DRAFT_497901 [Sporormia fimetaria CBS 119925]|uniref:Coenzyme Q-binding protein COQ10 START domain-containing protein n=1 Tax=Sporormia fimetaria CBS 119925 TaxID=1340428 RepID=A0A6A6UU02_9PLEO|nr:hypothetical protein M011DRAFT_497901 [Sporormia fimetaria CBS 119925]